jgi:poly-gamma-glutamate capsule biosynthesis protein CapA/YwtB (metallophosphatase superfamily)
VEWLPDPERLVAPLRPLVADADIVLVNVEGAIGEGPAPRKCRSGSTTCYQFRQAPRAAGALRGLAPDAEVVGNVANNHALDAGQVGLATTIRYLESAGVHVTGADTQPTLVVTERFDTVAVLGFSTAEAGPDPRDLPAVSRHVARARAITARVVVTMHMGAEGRGAQRTRDTTELFLGEDRGNVVAFARVAVQAGASVVFGHGPHVMRAAEWQGDALIFYSLGNLATYGPFNLTDPSDRGAIACATLDPEGRVARASLRSTRQVPPGVVSADPTGRAAWLVDSLSRLDFPETGAHVASEGAILPEGKGPKGTHRDEQ